MSVSLSFLLPLLAAVSPVRALSQAADTTRVVIVATTDVHGRATHWDYESDREAAWGLTRAATALDSLRRLYPGAVVLVDAGDLIQGNPFATYAIEQRVDPNPIVDALNFLNYDAATPGNHEFDFGLDVFGRAADAAIFRYVSGNIYRLPRDTLAFPRYVTLRRGSATVGITGFTTTGVTVWDRTQLVDRVRLTRILPEADKSLRAMAAAGVDLSVVLIHSGLSGTSNYDTTGVGPENVAAQLATLLEKPDLVIVGHSHQQIVDTVIGGVHFVQPAPWARGLSVVHAEIRKGRGAEGRLWRVVRIRADQVPLGGVTPDPAFTRRFQALHDQVRSWAGAPLAQTDDAWSARYARAEDTPIIDLVNEVQRRATGAQLSSTAAFNPAVAFGPGAVRLRDIAALYPYENTLKVVRIDGGTLARYLEQSARYFRDYTPGGPIINDSVAGFNYDIVSGVTYAIDLTHPVGSRIIQLSYGGRLVEPTDTFTLAVNSYRQTSGGGFDLFSGLRVVSNQNESVRDLLVDAVRRAGVLRAADYFTDSWRLIPPEARQRVRQAFESPR